MKIHRIKKKARYIFRTTLLSKSPSTQPFIPQLRVIFFTKSRSLSRSTGPPRKKDLWGQMDGGMKGKGSYAVEAS